MNEIQADTPITAQRQQQMLAELKALAVWRAAEVAAGSERAATRAADARSEHQRQHAQATAQFEDAHARLIAEYHERREAVYLRYEAEGHALAVEEQRLVQVHDQRHAESLDAAKTLRQHRVAEVQRTFREQKLVPRQEFAQFQQRCAQSAEELTALTVSVQTVVRRRARWPEDAPPAPQPAAGHSRQQYVEQFTAALASAYVQLQTLTTLRSARFLEEGWPVLIFLALLAALGYPAYRLLGTYGWGWVIAACVGTALVVAVAIRAVVRPLARRATLRRVPALLQAIAEARACLGAALAAAKIDADHKHQQLAERASSDLAAAKAEYKKSRRELKAQHTTRRQQAATEYATRRRIVEDTHERELDLVEDKHPRRIESLEQQFAKELGKIDEALRHKLAASRHQSARELDEVAARWTAGLNEFSAAIAAMQTYCDRVTPPWEAVAERIAGPAPSARADDLAALRIGRLHLDMEPVPALQLPAVLSYPDCPSLLLEAADDGRDVATQTLQSVMLDWKSVV